MLKAPADLILMLRSGMSSLKSAAMTPFLCWSMPLTDARASNISGACVESLPMLALHQHWWAVCVQETSLADLQQGRDNLQRELKERTGQLKALVKENFDRFIRCKTCAEMGLSKPSCSLHTTCTSLTSARAQAFALDGTCCAMYSLATEACDESTPL